MTVKHVTIVVVRKKDDGRLIVTRDDDKVYARYDDASGRTILTDCPSLRDYLNRGGWETIELANLHEESWIGVVSKQVTS